MMQSVEAIQSKKKVTKNGTAGRSSLLGKQLTSSKIFMSTHEKMLHQKRAAKNTSNPVASMISQTMAEPLNSDHNQNQHVLNSTTKRAIQNTIAHQIKQSQPKNLRSSRHGPNSSSSKNLNPRAFLQHNTVCSEYSMNSLGSLET